MLFNTNMLYLDTISLDSLYYINSSSRNIKDKLLSRSTSGTKTGKRMLSISHVRDYHISSCSSARSGTDDLLWISKSRARKLI